MKTVDEIRFIVAPAYDRDNDLVRAFTQRPGNILYYDAEEEMDAALNSLRNGGIPSKEVLVLRRFRGRFFQKCPGSPGMICCNYRVMNTCFNCLYNCAYCFLNSYLNSYGIVQFTNLEDLFSDLREFIASSRKDMVYRIGTGEFTDSLMFDEVTGIGRSLIAETAGSGNVMLELKTKSSNIDHLVAIRDRGHAVLSWTLGTNHNISHYEEDTATLDERLASAARASEAGYFTAFHLDPVILYDGWKEEYEKLLEKLFREVDSSRIPWISLGGFRYSPGFKAVLRELFPKEKMTLGEMFPGADGKLRYFKPARREMYKFLIDRITSRTTVPFLYLCMESSEMWYETMKRNYSSSDELEKDFSDAMKEFLASR